MRIRVDRVLGGLLAALAVAVAGAPPAQAAVARNGVRSYVYDIGAYHVPCVTSDFTDPAFIDAVHIAWAPNGVGAAIQDRDGAVTVINTRTCAQRVVARGTESSMSFSPDSRSLAVSRGGDLWLISAANGATVKKLTRTPGIFETEPSVSPDGSTVAYRADDAVWFVSLTTGRSTLWRKNATAPEFSPDGTRLAYQVPEFPGADRGDNGRILIAGLSDGSLRDTKIDASVDDYVWSPDATSFFFTAGPHSDSEFTCIVARTTGKITERGPGPVCSTPAWQPLP